MPKFMAVIKISGENKERVNEVTEMIRTMFANSFVAIEAGLSVTKTNAKKNEVATSRRG